MVSSKKTNKRPRKKKSKILSPPSPQGKKSLPQSEEIGGGWRALVGLASLCVLFGFLFSLNRPPASLPEKTVSIDSHPRARKPLASRPVPPRKKKKSWFNSPVKRMPAGLEESTADPRPVRRVAPSGDVDSLPEKFVTAKPSPTARPASRPKPAILSTSPILLIDRSKKLGISLPVKPGAQEATIRVYGTRPTRLIFSRRFDKEQIFEWSGDKLEAGTYWITISDSLGVRNEELVIR